MSNTNKEKPALVGGRYEPTRIYRLEDGTPVYSRYRDLNIQRQDSLKQQTQRVLPADESTRPIDPNAVKNTIDRVMAVLENLRENGLVGKAPPRGPDKGCG